MTKFNKQRFYNLTSLFRDLEKDIYQARINVWEALWAIKAATATGEQKKIKDLTDILKIERIYLVELLDRRRYWEQEIAQEIKKGGTK